MARIVRTDRELEMARVDATLRAAGHEVVVLPDGVSEATLCDAVRDAGLILMCYTPITQRVIDAAPRLKGILKYGVGIDAIDIEAAKARGIPVVNVPEYAEETVAEGAMTLMLALAKKLKPIQRAMDGEGWAWPESRWMGLDLSGRTLGVIGLGRIGSRVARMAGKGFRMRVLGYSPHSDAARFADAGVERRTDLALLAAESDFLSVHCVLNDETRGLVSAACIEAMKPGIILVNTARGAIVDENAMIEALKSGHIRHAGLDVFNIEPLPADHPLTKLENVTLSAHSAFRTPEASENLLRAAWEHCRRISKGK